MERDKVKILVIDDNKDNLITLKALIKESFPEAETLTTQNGTEGFEIAARENPGVILLDIIMPGVDGFAVCKRLKSDIKTSDIPVIFITDAKDDRGYRIRALEAGGDAFLSKPVDESELTAQIRAMLKIKAAADEKKDEKKRLEKLIEERTRDLQDKHKTTLNLFQELQKENDKRKLSEADLRFSEEKYQLIISSINEGLIQVDNDDRIIFVNKKLCEMFGYSKDELIGKIGYEMLIHEEDQIIIKKKNIARSEINQDTYGVRGRKKSGEIMQLSISGSAINNKKGNLLGSVGLLTDITYRVKMEEALRQSEMVVRKKLKSILEPEGNIGDLQLADIIDTEGFQSILEDFYHLTGIGSAIVDLDGNVLVAVGWQDICTKFHRIHPETLKNCIESDIHLSHSVPEGEYKLYRCKNNMMDMATPIVVGDKHLGNVFYGQFFLSDEVVDVEIFRKQAKKYGFDEKEYMEALEKVPLWDKETINRVMLFYSKLTGIISNLSYSTIKLGRSLTQQQISNEELLELKNRYQSLFENSLIGIGLATFDGEILDANEAFADMLGYSITELKSMNVNNAYYDINDRIKLIEKLKQTDKVINFEIKLKRKDGTVIDVLSNISLVEIKGKKLFQTTCQNITEQKETEFQIKSNQARLQSLVRIMQHKSDSVQRFLDYVLKESISLTGSKIGYIYFYSEEKKEFILNTWSEGVMKECSITDQQTIYQLEKTGIWGEAVRQRKEIVINDFPEPSPLKKGYPEGHAPLHKFLTIPVFHGNKIVAVVGVANKEADYDRNDILQLQLLMDGAWKEVEWQRSKIALEESEEKFRSLVDQAAEMLFLHDLKGNLVDVNKASIKNTGYSREDLNSMNVLDIDPDAHDRNDLKKYWQNVNLDDPPVTFETKHKRKDGSIYPAEVTVSKVKIFGDNYILGMARDISERKRSEAIQSMLYNIANAVNKTLTLEELIDYIKLELSKLIDTTNFFIAMYDKHSKTLTLPYFKDEMDYFESFPAEKTLTHYMIKTRMPLYTTKEKIIELEKAGEIEKYGSDPEIWIGIPFYHKSEVTGAMVLQSYDNKDLYQESDLKLLELVSHQIGISLERKKAEENLRKSKDKAEESDRLKSAFLANMSHEIRTPMNGILGFMDLLKDPQFSDQERDEFIEIARKSGQRLLETINNIIEISKIEAGSTNIHLSPVNIDELMQSHYKFFKPQIDKKGITFRIICRNNEQLNKVSTDLFKLDSIIINLIGNAIKFTKKGTIEIGYNLDGKMIKFYVKDTGIGIPPDKQKTIFEPFLQADSKLTSAYEGSGLGLSISKAYIEMLGGEIWLNSKPGEGTTFFFTISYKPLNEDSSTFNEVKEVNHTNLGNEMTLLIAEDDTASFKYLKIILANPGIKILHAKDGIEAIEVLKSNPDITLILMDIKMPVMDGIDATKQIRHFNKTIPIIAQTAHAFSSDKERAIESGCNDHISKPINKDELIKMIRKYSVNVKEKK